MIPHEDNNQANVSGNYYVSDSINVSGSGVSINSSTQHKKRLFGSKVLKEPLLAGETQVDLEDDDLTQPSSTMEGKKHNSSDGKSSQQGTWKALSSLFTLHRPTTQQSGMWTLKKRKRVNLLNCLLQIVLGICMTSFVVLALGILIAIIVLLSQHDAPFLNYLSGDKLTLDSVTYVESLIGKQQTWTYLAMEKTNTSKELGALSCSTVESTDCMLFLVDIANGIPVRSFPVNGDLTSFEFFDYSNMTVFVGSGTTTNLTILNTGENMNRCGQFCFFVPHKGLFFSGM